MKTLIGHDVSRCSNTDCILRNKCSRFLQNEIDPKNGSNYSSNKFSPETNDKGKTECIRKIVVSKHTFDTINNTKYDIDPPVPAKIRRFEFYKKSNKGKNEIIANHPVKIYRYTGVNNDGEKMYHVDDGKRKMTTIESNLFNIKGNI